MDSDWGTHARWEGFCEGAHASQASRGGWQTSFGLPILAFGLPILATVLDDGFEYRGKTYRSLSAVAREATGTIWNGFLFFKVIPYARREQAQSEGGAR